MKVVNLVPWAGLNFSYVPGDVIEMSEPTARARIDAGLAEAFDEKVKPPVAPAATEPPLKPNPSIPPAVKPARATSRSKSHAS
jgi:hypothetical protein